MNFIIFDLEATCWETKREQQSKTQEIIEIGALKIDEDCQIIGKFEAFIRPKFHPMISDFCHNLTSISQVQLNQADYFEDVVQDFKDWIDLDEDYLFASWGFFDQRILSKNCKLYQLDDEWTKPHINLKVQYAQIKGLRVPIGMHNALEREGFEFDGRQHRGIDDAKNLSKIFIKHINRWHS